MSTPRTLPLLLIAAILTACQSAETPASLTDRPTLALAEAESVEGFQTASERLIDHRVGQQVTGHGNQTAGGELRTFSFNAIRHPDFTVTGEWEVKSRASGTRLHGEITCFRAFARPLDPERGGAFISGKVTGGNGAPPGTLVIFNAFDNGEGTNALFEDFLSPLFSAGPLTVQRQCNFGIALNPVTPIEAGNIQVRP